MSQSVNVVHLLGHCGGEPDQLTGGGIAFSLATSERWTERESGAARERTDWHRVVVFGSRAAGLAPIIRKGLRLHITGHLRAESYDGADGTKRKSVDVIADDVVILTPRPEGDRVRDGRDNPAQNGGE
jgi:single-strand DNA-binding protein